MMINPVHTSMFLDTRRSLKDGTFPVKLRITFQRNRKYFPTNFTLLEEDYLKVLSEKPKGKYKELQLAFQAIEQKAQTVINSLPIFTFEAFEKKFFSNKLKNDVFSFFQFKINQLQKEGRAGTASSYECAQKSISTYRDGKPLQFSSITPEFLVDYEKWMLDGGKSLTTVGIYLRALRALYNDAIAAGEAHQELYPFGKRKYQTPAGRNIKKALPLEDVGKIFSYEPAHAGEAKARDLWIFSYLCNGINIKDIARLKYQSIEEERITFIRAKTERTTRKSLKSIVAVATPQVKEIISKWGNKPEYGESYVFPILTDGLTPKQELAKVRNATKDINKYIKRIATKVGIEKKVSSSTARHSFSTILKRSEVPISFISESLGHSDLRTTEHYLDSFEDKMKKHYSEKLTAFASKNEKKD